MEAKVGEKDLRRSWRNRSGCRGNCWEWVLGTRRGVWRAEFRLAGQGEWDYMTGRL